MQIAYLARDGDHDPLWFTLGKGDFQQQDALIIPTIYTLWKNHKLLPSLFTPKAVIPILSGGADLMIPGGKSASFRFVYHTKLILTFEDSGSLPSVLERGSTGLDMQV